MVAGGATPDGDLPPGRPFRIHSPVVGLAIVGLMTAIFGWVAFGLGTRQFRVIRVPVVGWGGGELPGRAVFGVWAVLMAAFFVVNRQVFGSCWTGRPVSVQRMSQAAHMKADSRPHRLGTRRSS